MYLDFSFFGFGKPKPMTNRGTRMALTAGERMLKQNGVNPHLKDAVKKAMRNRTRVAMKIAGKNR